MQRSFEKFTIFTAKNYAIIGIALFLLGLFFCLFQEVNRDDETWFLQVVNRVLSGEVLYKDIYFGAFPLSVYAAALFCWPFGAELLIARSLLALYFTLSVLLSCAILKELKATSRFSICFILSFFVFSHFQSSWGYSAYNGLAKVFFLGCFLSALKWESKPIFTIIAGCSAGLCFCSKQNVGTIDLFVLLMILIISIAKKQFAIKEGIKKISVVLLSFSLVTVICLLPTYLQGGSSQLVDYAILNKQRYLQTEHATPYFLIPQVWDSYSLFIFVCPFLLVLIFILSYPYLKKEKGLEPIIVLLFFAGSILNLYPRADNPQKMVFIPFALISLAYLSHKIPWLNISKISKALKLAIGLWFSLFFIFLFSSQFEEYLKKPRKTSKLPHLNRIYMKQSEYAHWKSLKENFLAYHNGAPIFFLSTHCGFYYLLFELPNPTPFDYPIHPAFGQRGEEFIIQKIRSGHISKVFLDHQKYSNWQAMIHDRHPLILEAFLNDQMKQVPFPQSKYLNSIFEIYIPP